MHFSLQQGNPYEHLLHIWEDLVSQAPEVEGKKFRIQKATIRDARGLNIRAEQADTYDRNDLDFIIRMHAWMNLLTPMNYTLFHGDDILVMITIMPIADGVGDICFLTDNNLANGSKLLRFNVIKLFKQALLEAPFRRLQAKVKEGFDIGTNFVEKLGFEREGLLKQFGGDGSNYHMYGMLK